MAVKLGLARQLFETDPAQPPTLLEELRSDVQTTLTELRELAHGIYPPLLRTAACRRRCGQPPTGRRCRPACEADDLPRFDAEIEAAVYFCCLEAMQNAGKYAGRRARSP